jgi:hypothetical protein
MNKKTFIPVKPGKSFSAILIKIKKKFHILKNAVKEKN